MHTEPGPQELFRAYTRMGTAMPLERRTPGPGELHLKEALPGAAPGGRVGVQLLGCGPPVAAA